MGGGHDCAIEKRRVFWPKRTLIRKINKEFAAEMEDDGKRFKSDKCLIRQIWQV